MQDVFIVNPKGGSGKTTIATQLAGYFSQLGVSTGIVDHDPQRSCIDWSKGRPQHCPSISVVSANARNEVIGCEIVIHDMPAGWQPHCDPTLITSGSKILVPVLPSSTDVKSCLRFIMQLYRDEMIGAQVDIALVANRVRTNVKFFPVLMEFLEKVDLPLLGQLRDTQNYVNVMNCGGTIFDVSSSKLSKDREQWEDIVRWADPAHAEACT